jgi:Cu2+-exporting ATPase
LIERGASPRVLAVLGFGDELKPEAKQAVDRLHAAGIRTAMVSGDNPASANAIAQRIGIDDVRADVLPEEKAAVIQSFKQGGRLVAMVGDGVNDAPALAQAEVGIAIGAGTDVAIETADVVLMRSDPLDVATAVEIGRGTVRKMRQNLGWAIGYNSLALPIAAGVFEPWGLMLRPEIAAISMSGSSVLVAVNALALKRLHLPGATEGAATADLSG